MSPLWCAEEFRSFVVCFSAVFSTDLEPYIIFHLIVLIFFFLTISYAYFSKYCESLPFCVRCCDRHVEKGNPCARILASYENQLNITLAYTALTMLLCAQGEFAWEYRLIWTWCKEETPGRAGGAAGSSVCGLKLPVVHCKDRLVRACQIVLLGLRC